MLMNHHSTGVWYKQLGSGPEQNGQGVDSPCLLSQACSITVSQVLDISNYHKLSGFPLFYTKSTLKNSDKYSLPFSIPIAIYMGFFVFASFFYFLGGMGGWGCFFLIFIFFGGGVLEKM